MAHEEYCHIFFERFREINIMQAAVEYARVCFSCCCCCSFKSKEFDFGISLELTLLKIGFAFSPP